nr:MFS transporter [Geodermatophilus sabuli]
MPLVAICTGTFILLVDVTIVNVALPDMAADLATTYGQLQWVVDVYALALASLVLGAGSLADLYGRRRVYVAGLVVFAVASLACGLAPNAELLLVARAVQGIGGAAMFATTIAQINTSYEGRDRGTAFGVWGAVVGAAAALGPIVGGALSELSWRWIFFVNLPVCVVAVALTLAVVQEARQPGAPHPDVPGIALFTLGAGLVVFGLVRAAADGWTGAPVWGALAGGAVVLAGWVAVERRRREPMLDVALFANRSFTGIMLGALLLNGAAFSSSLFISLWLQSVLGLSPLQGGLVFIPLSLLSFAVAAGAGRYLQTLPPRFVLAGGLGLVGVGSLLMAFVDGSSGWVVLVPGLTVLGIGVGAANPTLAASALATVPRERSGMASGAVNTARQLGFALGVAVLGSVFTARVASVLADAGTPDPAGTASALSAGQAGQVLGSAEPSTREALANLVAVSYADGLRDVFLVSGVGGVLGGLLVLWLVRAEAPGGGRRAPDRAATGAPAATR